MIVNGRSVSSEQYPVSKMTGECRQGDVLWPDLTAREHLELFGGMRGVPRDEMAGTVQRWLESVDLDGVQHTRAGAFSEGEGRRRARIAGTAPPSRLTPRSLSFPSTEGMKHRLSVALATIGDASVVVLDEPTTVSFSTIRRDGAFASDS